MRNQDSEFRLGKYYLKREGYHPSWKACWFDELSGRVKRKSLGETDFDSAKLKFIDFVRSQGAAPVASTSPSTEVQLLTVMVEYYDGYAKDRPSADVAKDALVRVKNFFGAESVASALLPDRQEAFWEALARGEVPALKRGASPQSPGTIARLMAAISAAGNWCVRKRILGDMLPVITSEDQIAEHVEADGTMPYRRLTVEELARFLDGIEHHHFFRYAMLALNTLARPDAICEATERQVLHDFTILDLNPPGRRQNKKFRPTVPITPTLAGWLKVWDLKGPALVKYAHARVGSRHGEIVWGPIQNPKKAFKGIAERAGLISFEDLDASGKVFRHRAVTPYTLRRTMGRLLRAEGVPLADIGAQMGHKIPGFNTTEIYADADPLYLKPVVDGIERIMDKIAAHTKQAPVRVLSQINSPLTPQDPFYERVYMGRKP